MVWHNSGQFGIVQYNVIGGQDFSSYEAMKRQNPPISYAHVEDCIANLEAKERLSSTKHLTTECLVTKIQTLNVKFKEHYLAIIKLFKDDENKLEQEQTVMDNYDDKVADIVESLQQLQPEPKTASLAVHSTNHSTHLRTVQPRLADTPEIRTSTVMRTLRAFPNVTYVY